MLTPTTIGSPASMRQPGSAWKPLVYLAAFRTGLDLDTTVPDEPIDVPTGPDSAELDRQLRPPVRGPDAGPPGPGRVPQHRGRLDHPRDRAGPGDPDRPGAGNPLPAAALYQHALGASEVRLLELAGAYRAMASGILAEPHIVDRVTDASGEVLYRPRPAGELDHAGLRQIQEGLRGVVRIPGGTANALNRRDFPIPVMGKTGTTNDFRDALFVGSTYGPQGITVAVRIGFDDNRSLGARETGGRAALPIFREIMLRVYKASLRDPCRRSPARSRRGSIGTWPECRRTRRPGKAFRTGGGNEPLSAPPLKRAATRTRILFKARRKSPRAMPPHPHGPGPAALARRSAQRPW